MAAGGLALRNPAGMVGGGVGLVEIHEGGCGQRAVGTEELEVLARGDGIALGVVGRVLLDYRVHRADVSVEGGIDVLHLSVSACHGIHESLTLWCAMGRQQEILAVGLVDGEVVGGWGGLAMARACYALLLRFSQNMLRWYY